MYDLHSHILPEIDDGAATPQMSLDMAREAVAQGVLVMACTPHILPGVYHNSGPLIRQAVNALQTQLNEADISLQLVTGADNHVVPDFVTGLQSGHLLSLGDTRYVLVEPPHHVAPARLEEFFFDLLIADYVPILTHPERLKWIESKYDVICRLASRGVWMQITTGSLRGSFGRRAQYWAERMISEGLVHILATDTHNLTKRPPDLAEGRHAAERLVGAEEAYHLVVTRPYGVLSNLAPGELPVPVMQTGSMGKHDENAPTSRNHFNGGVAQRLRRFFT